MNSIVDILPSFSVERVGGTILHSQVAECPFKAAHLEEDCTIPEQYREGERQSSQQKSSNPKDVLAREEQRVLLHLIPSPGLIHTALAMMDGARKYGPYNWRDEGVASSTYLSAAMRHIRDWLDGEEVAPDSEVHHLGHAAACLMILMDAQAVGNLVDDRPEPAPTSEMMEAVKAGDQPHFMAPEDSLDQAIAEMAPYEPGTVVPCQRDDTIRAAHLREQYEGGPGHIPPEDRI